MRNYRRLCTHTFYIGELKTVSTTRNRYALTLLSRYPIIFDYLRFSISSIFPITFESMFDYNSLAAFDTGIARSTSFSAVFFGGA